MELRTSHFPVNRENVGRELIKHVRCETPCPHGSTSPRKKRRSNSDRTKRNSSCLRVSRRGLEDPWPTDPENLQVSRELLFDDDEEAEENQELFRTCFGTLMRVENYAHELFGIPETPQAEDSLDQKRREIIQKCLKIGRDHELQSDVLNDLNDGEATAIGVSSCLMEAPEFTVESLGDTVRLCFVVCICINGVPVCMCNRLLYKRTAQPRRWQKCVSDNTHQVCFLR